MGKSVVLIMLENFSLDKIQFDESRSMFNRLLDIAQGLLVLPDSVEMLGENHIVPEEADWGFESFGVDELGIGFEGMEILEENLLDEFRLYGIFIEISDLSE